MATQTTVLLIDDLDGTPAAETVEFALDGVAYEIDLNEQNAKKLRDAVNAYVAAGRPVSKAARGGARRGRRTQVTGNSREYLAAVRTWARKHNYEVSDRGRIAQNILDAFEAAH